MQLNKNSISQFNSVTEFHINYDLFLIDLWGVIHDGEELYSGVKKCLEMLKSKGKKIVFVSNAPRRVSLAEDGLIRLGITSDLYDGIITSGEITYDFLTSKNHDFGKRYILIEEQEIDLIQGSGFESVNSENDADFVIAIGFERPNAKLEELTPRLCNYIKKDLPIICANPDLVIVDKKGVPSLCAGVMANKYIEMGGKVTFFGKPYSHIYEHAFSLFPDIQKNKICAIGDNIATDIKGGNNMKIDTYLIAGGIHGGDLNIKHGQLPDLKKLIDFCDLHKAQPTGVLASFVA